MSESSRCCDECGSSTGLLKRTVGDWLNGLDVGQYAGVVFVDVKKVFDTVDRGTLL